MDPDAASRARRRTAYGTADGKARIFLYILVALVYGDSVLYGYINDDFDTLGMTLSHAVDYSLHSLLFRPVWNLSVGLINSIGQSSLFDHALSVGLFMIAAGMGYQVERRYGVPPRSALLAICAWVLLPWMVFPAVWVSQRNDVLTYLFTFGALLAAASARPLWSLPLMTLGLLTKESVMLVPLFFVWTFWRERRRPLALGFAVVWAAYMAVVVHHYVLYHVQYEAPHLAPLAVGIRVLNCVSHWIEPFVTQVVPLPFFTGVPHLLLYGVGLVLLVLSVRVTGAGPARGLLLLVLLASFPSVITPQLRIVGFESFCILLVLARVLTTRRPRLFAVSFLVLTISSVISIQATKRNFQTSNYDPLMRRVSADVYYPNDFYRRKREALLRWLGR